MIIPRVIFIEDYEGITDINGNKLDEEQIKYLIEKLEDYLESKKGYLQKEGYVYFIKDVNNLVKIGCTEDIKRRMYNLKSKNEGLKLLRLFKCNSMVDLERYFHIIFRENRVTGEWFKITEEEVLNYKIGVTESYWEALEIYD